MGLRAAVGQSWDLSAVRAGSFAAQQAVDSLNRSPVSLGWVFASTSFSLEAVLEGVLDVTGDIPVLGVSAETGISSRGRSQKSVLVGLLSDETVHARVGWWPDFLRDGRACISRMLDELAPNGKSETLFLLGDGLGTETAGTFEALGKIQSPVAGCFTCGDLLQRKTYQFGGRRIGSGGLAGAVLEDGIAIGVGTAHGWRPIGALTRITRTRGRWVRKLDDLPPNEFYARFLGHSARDWVFPPLNDLVRLYPFGVKDGSRYQIYAPMRLEADGSLRMSKAIPEGMLVDLMVGSEEACRQAVVEATHQALSTLQGRSPRLALLFVDSAWQTLLALDPQLEIDTVRSVLGDGVPIIGSYTLGQIIRPESGLDPEILNHNIEVVLFG